jgi:SAM-dependent methyltransferase
MCYRARIVESSIKRPVCSVCGEPHSPPFFELGSLPVLSCALWAGAERAKRCLQRPVELCCCKRCGFVENVVFDAKAAEYSELYENALHFSKLYREYARKEAERLIERLELRNKDVFEIGSGDGRFLSLLCELGENRGLGFDPSYADEKADHAELHPNVRLVPEYYGSEHAALRCDLVISRHVLEHIPNPLRFMSGLRTNLAQNPQAILAFEVPDARYLLDANSLWDIIYEHCSYFSAPALARLFRDSGFSVREIRSTFGGQCLAIEAGVETNSDFASADTAAAEVDRLVGRAEQFGRIAKERLAECRARLHALAGRRVALWGAGARAVVCMNMIDVGEVLGMVVDLNPRKHGYFLPGVGLRVEPPTALVPFAPEVVLIMNPIYEREIGAALTELGIDAQVQTV